MVKVLEKVVGWESIPPASYADEMWSLYGLFYDVADVFIFIMEVPHAFYLFIFVIWFMITWDHGEYPHVVSRFIVIMCYRMYCILYMTMVSLDYKFSTSR